MVIGLAAERYLVWYIWHLWSISMKNSEIPCKIAKNEKFSELNHK
jgi:hypothetical protein